jgi:hypothetical protein
MKTPSDIEQLPAVVAPSPDMPAVLAPVDGGSTGAYTAWQQNVPILDRDLDDIVPGYSDSDSWYEP